jgi:CPA2 family monovalent cation:H+ antiporter-2
MNDAFVLAVSALVVVTVLHRVRASPVLGYLVAGVAIGPSVLGLMNPSAEIGILAELGVVFLLFLYGLELSFARLRTMRRLVFGLGGAQVLVTAAAIGGIAWLWGNPPRLALVLGVALALSSTAVIVQLLVERGEMASRVGRTSFAILLFQDLAVVPLLVLVPILAGAEDPVDESPIWELTGLALIKATTAIGIILLVGRYLLRWPYRWVAATRSSELFVALTLLVVLGTGWLTHRAGLSMALGAFLAGLVLAETEYRHQVEADIRPFKGLLLGLFFISVGMSLDLARIWTDAFWIGAAVVGLVVLKSTLAAALCLAFGVPAPVAVRSGMLIGAGGEFLFVVVPAALAVRLMDVDTGQFMMAVTGLTMLLTPGLVWAGARLAVAIERRTANRAYGPDALDAAGLEHHVLIAGFGRVGETVARLLAEQAVAHLAVDLDAGKVQAARARGAPVIYGDAARADVLERLGAERASALVVTLDDPETARRTVDAVRRRWPDLRILARAHDASCAEDLRALGVAEVVPETIESSLSLARSALAATGLPSEAVAHLGQTARAGSRDE